jgi:hypothetical protein
VAALSLNFVELEEASTAHFAMLELPGLERLPEFHYFVQTPLVERTENRESQVVAVLQRKKYFL